MKKNLFNKNPFLTRLYIFSGIVVLTTITKYLIISYKPDAIFIFMELFSIIVILAIVYMADHFYRSETGNLKTLQNKYDLKKTEWENEKQSLLIKITEFEDKENEAKRFSSYQEKMMKQLFETTKENRTKHHFLHLLTEVFQAGAAILYKETEPGGQFIVEESYALPEDFQPAPFSSGEGLNGQAVLDKNPIVIEDIPDGYIPVTSGLGNAKGNFLYLLPIINKGKYNYLIEMVSFNKIEIEKMWNNISAKLIEKDIL